MLKYYEKKYTTFSGDNESTKQTGSESVAILNG
jgi:hypothetical protein